MAIDLNNAPPQREMGLIDDGTICVVHMTVRPGNAGDGGWLKRSKEGESNALDVEFTVVDGPFAKRKFWKLFTLEGVTDGHAKAGEISASQLRAIIESARGIKPDDKTEAAMAARRIESWGDFDGLRFIAKVGIEKAEKGSGFKDKNVLDAAVTPDKKAWTQVEQVLREARAAGSVANTLAGPTTQGQPAGGIQKPKWATGG
jgi:hypothetical protein